MFFPGGLPSLNLENPVEIDFRSNFNREKYDFVFQVYFKTASWLYVAAEFDDESQAKGYLNELVAKFVKEYQDKKL